MLRIYNHLIIYHTIFSLFLFWHKIMAGISSAIISSLQFFRRLYCLVGVQCTEFSFQEKSHELRRFQLLLHRLKSGNFQLFPAL